MKLISTSYMVGRLSNEMTMQVAGRRELQSRSSGSKPSVEPVLDRAHAGSPVKEFRILGKVEVADSGVPVLLPAGRQRALLALLILQANRPVSTNAIIEGLWGADPPASAHKIVQTYVSQLRKTLGDGVLVTDGHGYSLVVGGGALDSDQARQFGIDARKSTPEEAERLINRALDLWRGSPLQDVADDDFAQDEIRRLNELHERLLSDRVDVVMARGGHADVVGELETLVAARPLDERARAQLMLALYRCGRQSDALETYQDVRRLLADELGLEPAADLKALERGILNHDVALAAPAFDEAPPASQPKLGKLALFIGAGVLLAAVAAIATFVISRGGSQTGAADVTPNSIAVIDHTNRVVAQIPVGVAPTRISFGEGSVWAINAGDRTVSQINPHTRSEIRRFAVSTTPIDLVAGAGAVWVGGRDPSVLLRVDPASTAVTGKVDFGPTRDYLRADVAVDLAVGFGSVWAAVAGASPSKQALYRIDAASNRRLATIRPIDIGSIATGSGSVWTLYYGQLTRVDPATDAVTSVHKAQEIHGEVVLVPPFLWVADGDGGIWQLDPNAGILLRSVTVGDSASGLAFGLGSLWAASPNGTVTRINPASGKVMSTIHVGGTPQGITTGAGLVWVTVG